MSRFGGALLFLGLLLAAPGLALAHLGTNARGPLLVVVAIVSLFTLILYWTDKRAAQSGEWRTPELVLHISELLGGWPAAFLAQRVWRHKNAKLSYQVAFWLIVAVHQLLAADVLLDNRLSRGLWSELRRLLG